MYFQIIEERRKFMIFNSDLSQEFKKYDNLHALQIDNEHICKISYACQDKEVIIKFKNIKLQYKFNSIDEDRYFMELCLLDKFNRILAIAYKNDYIVEDENEIYVLNKDKFEKYYGVFISTRV